LERRDHFFTAQFAGAHPWAIRTGVSTDTFFPAMIGYLLLMLMMPAYNCFAYEGKGIQTYFTAPVRFRDVFLGKNIMHMGILLYFLYDGQKMKYLISDPLGKGWDLFGTASQGVDYSILSQETAWYIYVAVVVLGHVAGLTLAHDRALALYGQAKLAVRSQYWMLCVMVGFTTFGLWLLSQANQ